MITTAWYNLTSVLLLDKEYAARNQVDWIESRSVAGMSKNLKVAFTQIDLENGSGKG